MKTTLILLTVVNLSFAGVRPKKFASNKTENLLGDFHQLLEQFFDSELTDDDRRALSAAFPNITSELGQSESFVALLEKVLSNPSVNQLLVFLNKEIHDSTDLLNLYERISSAEAHELFEEVLASPEVRRLERRFRSLGAVLAEIIENPLAFFN